MAELLVDRIDHEDDGWTEDAIACAEEFKIEDFEHKHKKISEYQNTLCVPDYGIYLCYSGRSAKKTCSVGNFFFKGL